MIKNTELVYQFVKQRVSMSEVKEHLTKGTNIGVEAIDIEKEMGIVRNNASTLLNTLCKEGRLEKLPGRPVRFVTKDVAEAMKKSTKEELITEYNDPFTEMIGCNSILTQKIEQAKVAMMYPPNGLNTLLVGAPGVGKTVFAELMHKYVENKTGRKVPFVYFNCSDCPKTNFDFSVLFFGDSNQEGLIEKANNGIIFLDEVHKTPIFGQKQLVKFIESGRYAKLGEATASHASNVIFIATTHEEPEKVLLRTFYRKMPMVISLPTIDQYDAESRIEFIKILLRREAQKINEKIIVKNEAIKILAFYTCPGNIGQLMNDIEMICANAYLSEASKGKVEIGVNHLPNHIIDSYNETVITQKEDNWTIGRMGDIVVGPTGTEANKESAIINTKLEYKNKISEYLKQTIKVSQIRNIAGDSIVDSTIKIVKYLEEKEIFIGEDNFYSIVFFIRDLVENDVRPTVSLSDKKRLIELYPNEFEIAKEAVSILAKELNANFGENESVFFLYVLLSDNAKRLIKELTKIGIVIIQYGKTAAKSMSDVCNHFANAKIVDDLDLYIEDSMEDIHKRICRAVLRADKGNGVLVLTDLKEFKEEAIKAGEETDVDVVAFDNISTSKALEMVGKVIYSNKGVKELFV